MKKSFFKTTCVAASFVLALAFIFTACDTGDEGDTYLSTTDSASAAKVVTYVPQVKNFKVEAGIGVNKLSWDLCSVAKDYTIFKKVEGQAEEVLATPSATASFYYDTVSLQDGYWKSGKKVEYSIVANPALSTSQTTQDATTNTTTTTASTGGYTFPSERVSCSVSLKDPLEIGSPVPNFDEKEFALKEYTLGSQTLSCLEFPTETWGATFQYVMKGPQIEGVTDKEGNDVFVFENSQSLQTAGRTLLSGMKRGENDLYVRIRYNGSLYCTQKEFKVGTVKVDDSPVSYKFGSKGLSINIGATEKKATLVWDRIKKSGDLNVKGHDRVDNSAITYYLFYKKASDVKNENGIWTKVEVAPSSVVVNNALNVCSFDVDYSALDVSGSLSNNIEFRLFATVKEGDKTCLATSNDGQTN